MKTTDDFHVEALLELADHASLKSGSQAEDLGFFDGEPVDEFIKFFPEVTALDAEHGQRHRAVDAGGCHVTTLGGEAEKLGVVQQIIDPARRVPEK